MQLSQLHYAQLEEFGKSEKPEDREGARLCILNSDLKHVEIEAANS